MSDRKALKQEKKTQKQQKFLQKQTKHTVNTPKDRKPHKPTTPVPILPFGTIKDLSHTPAGFEPLYVEAGWYNWWLANKFFTPNTNPEKFVICIPPPNVTGKLHIGHAMMATIQDTLVRYNRMTGKSVLYLPGTDHAGIATQAVVERRLAAAGVNKESLTRAEFISEIHKWKNEHGDIILDQLKRLGLSCDFSRQVFTLDNQYSASVTEAFATLYERSLIYRKEKMVNWCGKMHTALSDLEVEVRDVEANCIIDVDDGKYIFGVMYSFLYPVINSNDEVFLLEVCTTRPETILGDSALCLNARDTRYNLKGCYAFNPITKKRLDIVFDDYCDPEYGSGVVKITPYHDSNDFEVAMRHKLKGVTILNEDNRIVIDNLDNTIMDTNKDCKKQIEYEKIENEKSTIGVKINNEITIENEKSTNGVKINNKITNENEKSTNGVKINNEITNEENYKKTQEKNSGKKRTNDKKEAKSDSSRTNNSFKNNINNKMNIVDKEKYKQVLSTDTTFLNSLHLVKRFEARKMVVEYLKKHNLFVAANPHSHALPFCSRSNDIIEPRMKMQWWMACNDLAARAKEVVVDGRIKIVPEESKKIYYNWLDNIRDWCLSRQLVWGHRIPAYRVYANKRKMGWVVGRNLDEAIYKYLDNENNFNDSKVLKIDKNHNNKNNIEEKFEIGKCEANSNIGCLKNGIDNEIKLKNEDNCIENKNTAEDCIISNKEQNMKSNTYNNKEKYILQNKIINEDLSTVEFTYNGISYKLAQDEDVLDTWFSSGLWPFATLGWPNKTQDFNDFFPTSVLETGSDILFFWVARMVMLSLELTNQIPFKTILLHGIVRDAHGKKMSKSLGNIIDPVFIIEGRTLNELNNSVANVAEKERKRAVTAQAKDFPNGIPCCGTDALRFTLCAYNNGTKDVNLDVMRVEGYRRMGNKIWNAFKFIKMIIERDIKECEDDKKIIYDKQKMDIKFVDYKVKKVTNDSNLDGNNTIKTNFNDKEKCVDDNKDDKEKNIKVTSLFIHNRDYVNLMPDLHIQWMYHNLNDTIRCMKESYETYDLKNATNCIYKLFLYDFCDIFIEIIKKRRCDVDKETAYLTFIDIIKMLHPIMPYLTEEIYQRLKILPYNKYEFKASICIDNFPETNNIDNQITLLNIKTNDNLFTETLVVLKGIRSIVDSRSIKTYQVEINNDVAAYYTNLMIKSDVIVVDNVKGQYIDNVGSIKYGIHDLERPESENVDSEDN